MSEPAVSARGERIAFAVSVVLRASLLVAAVIALLMGRWTSLFIIAGTLILTFLPAWVEKRLRVLLPMEIEVIFVAFVYAALFLGEVRSFYDRFWWWDLFLHALSGMTLGFVGFAILYVALLKNKVTAGPLIAALFSFSFGLALGAVWEIYEFTMDSLLGTNTQRSGLVDTMWDLIVDAAGALIASIAGYFYIKRKDQASLLGRLVNRLLWTNPQLLQASPDPMEPRRRQRPGRRSRPGQGRS